MSIEAAAFAAAFASGACVERIQGRHWQSERELVIQLGDGTKPGPSEVEQMVLLPDTTLFVLLPSERLVRKFGPFGAPLATIGGAGDSTVFRTPTVMGWWDPQLWVYDTGLNQALLFDKNGNPTRRIPVSLAVTDADSVVLVAMLITGHALARVWGPTVRTAADSMTTSALVRLAGPPSAPDTTFTLRDHGGWLVIPNPDQPDAPPVRMRQPFADAAVVAPSSGDGMIVIVEPTPAAPGQNVLRVTKINAPGDTVFSNNFDYDPVRLTSRHVGRMVDRIAAEIQPASAASRRRSLKDAIERALYRPRYLPTATGLVIASDGTILIRREDGGADSVAWTILTPTGNHVATQTTPSRTRFMTAGGPFLYGTERDSTGALTIARYRAVVPK
ncbi:MAG: hypothetical protein ACRENP_02615 [Longimicrobiales bacterium]